MIRYTYYKRSSIPTILTDPCLRGLNCVYILTTVPGTTHSGDLQKEKKKKKKAFMAHLGHPRPSLEIIRYVCTVFIVREDACTREKQQGRLAVGGGLGREAIQVMSGMLLLYNSRHLGLPSFDLQSSSGLTHSTSEHSAGT